MAHILVPNVYVEEHLLNREMGEIYLDASKHANFIDGHGSVHADNSYTRKQMFSAAEALSFETGVSVRQIWYIRNRDTSSQFRTVDRLFSGMEIPHVWHTDPNLYQFYALLGAEEEESEDPGILGE
jgi:hypothetical protein